MYIDLSSIDIYLDHKPVMYNYYSLIIYFGPSSGGICTVDNYISVQDVPRKCIQYDLTLNNV